MLAENVKKARELTGLSQRQFAIKCNVSRTAYRDIESGNKGNPTLITVCNICKGANIDITELVPKEMYT